MSSAGGDAPPLRLGVVHYLNAWPLAWGLWHGAAGTEVIAEDLPPAAMAARLVEGSLDAGLLPTVELQRHAGLSVVRGLGIAATAEVRSVLLIARRPLAELARVAVDENSRTSVALLRIVLADRHGVSPELVAAPPEVERMLAAHDGALVIGDPALFVDRSRHLVVDLAAEWRALTGLPFVFAVWAVSPACARAELAEVLRRSRAAGQRDFARLLAEAVAASGLDGESLRAYFCESLRYELGPAELAGLDEFHRRAYRLGLIPRCAPVRFWPE